VLSVLSETVVTTTANPVTINVLANDTGSNLRITSFSNPANGSLVFNGNKTFTYTSAAGFVGDDSFAYTVRDAQGTPASARVTISVVPNTGATVATDDVVEVVAGGSVIVPALANDMAADDGALQITAISMPGHGDVNVLPDQTIRYVPQSGFTGIDSFTYTVTDGQGSSASATVTVKVLARNSPPIAAADTFPVEAGQPTLLAVLANDSDPDGGPLQVVGFTMPSHGSLVFNPDRTFTYTPAAGFLGQDQFTYTIRDNRGASAVATVTLVVAEVSESPVAVDDQVTTEAGQPVTIDVLANDTLLAGQQVAIVAVTLPYRGKLAFNPDKTITYTPNPGFVGIDDFTYTISNGKGGTAKAKVTIEVTPATVTIIETYANGYGHRRHIVVPAQPDSAVTIEDGVVLVSEQDDWLKHTTHGGKVTSLDGADIRFEDVNGGKLDHEIEAYDPVVGRLLAWVRLPSWALASQLQLLLYYGNPAVVASESNPPGTWQGYLARWRLPDGTDATGEGRDLVPQGLAADSLVGEAARFDGNGNLMIAGTDWLTDLSAVTVQALVKPDASMLGSTNGILVQGLPDSTLSTNGVTLSYIALTSTGVPNVVHAKVNCSDGNAFVLSSANQQKAERQLIHGTWLAGNAPDLYLDGVKNTPSRSAARSGRTSVTGPLYIGAGWQGLIDEVRLAGRSLPADWVALEARNMLTPELSYGLGHEETVDSVGIPLVALPCLDSTTSGKLVEINVLAHTFYPGASAALTVTGVTQPGHGFVSVVENIVRYTPSSDFTGQDSFTYTVSDGASFSTSSIRIDVRSVPSQPSSGSSAGLPSAQRTRSVSDDNQLASALNEAVAGDQIVLANGTYSDKTISGKNGTSSAPIVIRAANPGQARINGKLTVNGGSHIWTWGINFQGPTAGIRIAGNQHKILGCRFADFGRSNVFTRDEAIATISRTDSLEIAYCLFENPVGFRSWTSADGQWPQWRFGFRSRHESAGAPYDLHIHHCHFRNFPDKPSSDYRSAQSDAIEIAPIGSNFDTRNRIDHCLFESIPDDNGSIIDAKAGRDGIVEYITAINCGGRIDLRDTDNWVLRHIWMENCQGIGVYGKNHTISDVRMSGGSRRIMLHIGNRSYTDPPGTDQRRQVSDVAIQCCPEANVRVGLDWTVSPTLLPRNVQILGSTSSVTIASGSTNVTQSPGYVCTPSKAFKLSPSQVGTAALPA
jgi:hypothetical protein